MSELNRLSPEEFKQAQKAPIVVILDNVRSMHNVGSIFRTSDAFAIEKLYLCGITARPPHRDIEKAALGATESVNWEYAADTLALINQLTTDGYTILSIEQAENSISLEKFQTKPNEKYAIIFGNEVDGVQHAVAVEPMVQHLRRIHRVWAIAIIGAVQILRDLADHFEIERRDLFRHRFVDALNVRVQQVQTGELAGFDPPRVAVSHWVFSEPNPRL